MEFDNIELIKRAIETEAGVGILPAGNVEREVQYGDLRVARFRDSKPWFRPIGVLRHRGKVPSPAERKFLGLLRERPLSKQAAVDG